MPSISVCIRPEEIRVCELERTGPLQLAISSAQFVVFRPQSHFSVSLQSISLLGLHLGWGFVPVCVRIQNVNKYDNSYVWVDKCESSSREGV